MKKTLAIVLAVLMMFSSMAVIASAETTPIYGNCGENGNFVLDVDNRVLKISGICDDKITVNQGQEMSDITGAFSKVIIADNTVIQASLFSGNKELKEVIVGKGVEFNEISTIGISAFNGCSALDTVTLQGDHYSLPAYCFKDCTSLESFDFAKVDSLGLACFQNSGLKGTVDLSKLHATTDLDGVSAARIYESAFQGCKGITYVILPLNAGNCIIGDSAFEGCTSLSKLTNGSNCVPKNVSKIGRRAFFDCALPFVLFEGNNVEIGAKAFGYISGDGEDLKYADFSIIAEEGSDGYNYGTNNSFIATPHEATSNFLTSLIAFFYKIAVALTNAFEVIIKGVTNLVKGL